MLEQIFMVVYLGDIHEVIKKRNVDRKNFSFCGPNIFSFRILIHLSTVHKRRLFLLLSDHNMAD